MPLKSTAAVHPGVTDQEGDSMEYFDAIIEILTELDPDAAEKIRP